LKKVLYIPLRPLKDINSRAKENVYFLIQIDKKITIMIVYIKKKNNNK